LGAKVSFDISSIAGRDLLPDIFLPRWNYKRHSEVVNTKKAAKLASNGHAMAHALTVSGLDYGFVAVDIYQFAGNKRFYLQILYLFVSDQYRSLQIEELDGMTPSQFLMGYAIEQSINVASFVPITAIVLQPVTDKLIPLYESLGFIVLPYLPHWMSLPFS
jgi:hypothetical protein